MNYILDGLRQAMELLGNGDPATFSAVWTTLIVTLEAMAATLVLGVPAGFLLGYADFPGKRAARLVVETFLSFPTVVIGLVVYAFISRRGPLGELGLLFTVPGMAVGLTILGLPIVIALTAQAVENLDRRLRPTLLTLGAKPRHVFFATLAEARFGMLLASTAAFGRIISEIGISMMLGGNIKWATRTITTAIALETGKGEFASGIALGMVLMAIAFLVNLAAAACRRRSAA
jgi:tungstate transport system permease protein